MPTAKRMNPEENAPISHQVTVFQGTILPEEEMLLAGYSALIEHYRLHVPLPTRLAAISRKHRKYHTDRWAVYTPKYKPDDTLAGHLTFALKHEGVDLAVLNALFAVTSKEEVQALVQREPTGQYSRRIWFFYEWLTGERLDLPDVTTGGYVDALDEEHQYPGPASLSKRHRVRDNLPGVRTFCPLIRRTPELDELIRSDLSQQAHTILGKVHPDIIARASAFLLLKDSKASYAIEGEHPPRNRAERWGQAIGQAGQQELTLNELLRLQSIVIENARFLKMGWRKEGGFIGMHDRFGNNPIPDHISARWQDLTSLLDGLIATTHKLKESAYDPVLEAAIIAFGFVFIHPFEDGNGRIHRYLIHHVLAEKGFTPKGIVFPVSAIILERIDEYRKTLESYSRPRLPLIEWEPTERGNVNVLNETIDLYRFFDATAQAEFLYRCVKETIEKSLPEEVTYLAKHDKMRQWVKEHFDMPDYQIELLIRFLRQGDGDLSKRALNKEFSGLSENEAKKISTRYKAIFGS